MKRYIITAQICIAISVLFIGVLVCLRNTQAFSAEKKIDGIEMVAQRFSEFTIPDDVRVVGIGEATHGNREFQLVKKEVFEKVVLEGDGRAICFEMAVGEAAMLNDAVHDRASDLTAAVGRLNYPIYDTPEMVSLLEWMREYNQTVPYEDSLMFYGVDMQGAETAVSYLKELCGDTDASIFTEDERKKLLAMASEQKADYTGERDFFVRMQERLSGREDLKSRQLLVLVASVLQTIDAPLYDDDPREYSYYRDRCMAENLKRYSEIEDGRGFSQVVITAHNGHVVRGGSTVLPSEGAETMGDQIDRLFDGSYYCIGTEFYEGYVNIHTAGTYDDRYHRADHYFCSDDPLAYQAKFFEDGTYCLDFSSITDENNKVYNLIHGYIFNGIAGEGYSPAFDIGKQHRMKVIPADRYDAVFYYYEVTPIRPMHYEDPE